MSAHDQLVVEEYEGISVDLPDGGPPILCKPLTVREFVRYFRLLTDFIAGDQEAYVTIITGFPETIGHPDLIDRLMPGEILELLNRFFTLARPFPESMHSRHGAAGRAASTEGSTIPGPTSPPGTDGSRGPTTLGTSPTRSFAGSRATPPGRV